MPNTSPIPELQWYENGEVVLGGKYLQLFYRLDNLFKSWSVDVAAKEYYFPTFVQARELQKLDYFKSFPHLVTFAAALESSHENIAKFIEGERINSIGQIQPTVFQPIEEVLTPAACYHFYILLQGRTFNEPQYFTTRCTCHRREKYYAKLKRQWAFSMREIVCIGSAEEVAAFVERYTEKIQNFVSSLELKVEWQTATDPFFNPSQNPKYLMQRLDPVKNELVFQNDLAIASTNLHRNYFGEAFELTCDGKEAFSGCVAFGLERWIYAVLTQYGDDEKNWPAPFRGLS